MRITPAWYGQDVWLGLTLCYPPQHVIMWVERGYSGSIPGALGQLRLAVLGPLQAVLEALDPVGILSGASGAESCTGALYGAVPPLPALHIPLHWHTMSFTVPFFL